MLQQILRDMYVDPEILAELDEQQKQTLFCKMREEQVRRWKSWNDKLGDDTPKIQSTKKKSVSFLKGDDGEPWVWVMGEHKNDKSIEDILKEEAREKARQMAEKEAEQLRKQMEAHLSEYMDLTPKIEELAPPKLDDYVDPYQDDMDIYCSVEEIREKMKTNHQNYQKPPIPKKPNYQLNSYQTKNNKFNFVDTREVLQEISLNSQVSQRVALWEKKMTEQRTTEIFKCIRKKQEQVAKEAEEEEKKKEQYWQEQERKAKEAEQQIREIARRARAEHRLTSDREIDTNYSTVNSGVPPNRQAVIDWYKQTEKLRLTGLDNFSNVEPWFHGLITRSQAEKLLLDQPYGTFLVRLSEKIWGYTISYRAQEKCKHYLVNALPKYGFSGANPLEHNSLGDLINYHYTQPLTGGDKLQRPCPRMNSSAIDELFETNNN
ncbi:SH2 domain-containing protein 4A-like [Anthonomus grandis grandis]|uniref:SH2 domain-containing protein 4A-like n=1 Tax=Anthonomus grandis grandis TaxID=2921223 RepID=UPI0021667E52|nr:SH2 domain-containing protein 4A-like [Anthonomus grandis grandis]XP_050297879.1 SH2 domain-containing protein 4A-like [Anthonomus grandis grandis]XP_050297880.1 SH2 domain-containing protein 4A-like [Anthonomus grandis grandis]